MKPYGILDISSWPATKEETLGTKAKVWLLDPDERAWLYKIPRSTSGDDWGEKAAAELADLLGLRHPLVELGRRDGQVGSISLDFTCEGTEQRWGLVTGNQLLWELDPDYPKHKFRGVRSYTVDKVLDLLIQCDLGPLTTAQGQVLSAPEVFVGYLLFDAWVGNQDRHHENWGILLPIAGSEARAVLAPSYDHASCLGQNLRDEERTRRLGVQDLGHISAWVRKARGALYESEQAERPLSPLGAFRQAGLRYPDGAKYWLQRLSEVSQGACSDVLARLPDERTSSVARSFAAEMLRLNRRDLLEPATP